MTDEQIQILAREGARIRLEEIGLEAGVITAAFPDLDIAFARVVDVPVRRAASTPRRRLSAAERNAISARMRRYWAGRRKAAAAAR